MPVVFGIGMILAMGGWATLAIRIVDARKTKTARNIGLSPHAAMTVLGVALMTAAYCLAIL